MKQDVVAIDLESQSEPTGRSWYEVRFPHVHLRCEGPDGGALQLYQTREPGESWKEVDPATWHLTLNEAASRIMNALSHAQRVIHYHLPLPADEHRRVFPFGDPFNT